MAYPPNLFRSPNLIYTAAESPEHDALFQTILTSPADYANSNARLHYPQSRKDAASYLKAVAEDKLLGVVICLPPTEPDQSPTPVGTIHLDKPSPHIAHHRFSEVGIDIIHEHQGKGYGSEAIRWCLDWAFDVAGLHRVAIRAFEWNEGARRLYEKIGFTFEGRAREELFYRGRWWDGYQFGMLDWEWRKIREEGGK